MVTKFLIEKLEFWKIQGLYHPNFQILEDIFESIPKKTQEKPLKIWKQEGLMEIRHLVLEGKLNFDLTIECKRLTN